MTIIRCADFETTGFPPDATVCEVGYTDVFAASNELGKTYATLCNPGRAIPANVQRVHGISDAMVAEAIHHSIALETLHCGADIMCAHNARFEQQLYTPPAHVQWICTYKCVRKIYPHLTSHKNGEVPALLGIEVCPTRGSPMHRAGPDTYVTALILQHLLKEHTVQHLLDITAGKVELVVMPNGEHKGKSFKDIPRSYVTWALKNMDDDAIKAAMRKAHNIVG